MQANSAEAHISLLEAKLRDAGDQNPRLQLAAPAGHSMAQQLPVQPFSAATAAHTPPTAAPSSFSTTPPLMKPAYQHLLAALANHSSATMPAHPRVCCAANSSANMPPWQISEQVAHAHDHRPRAAAPRDSSPLAWPAQSTAPPAAYAIRLPGRSPLSSVGNVLGGNALHVGGHHVPVQQVHSKDMDMQQAPTSSRAPRVPVGCGRLGEEQETQAPQPASDKWRQGNIRPLGGSEQAQSGGSFAGAAQGSSALERMQRLHERLKASEQDVCRRLGRMLGPTESRRHPA
jgi:hypothetical protein